MAAMGRWRPLPRQSDEPHSVPEGGNMPDGACRWLRKNADEERCGIEEPLLDVLVLDLGAHHGDGLPRESCGHAGIERRVGVLAHWRGKEQTE